MPALLAAQLDISPEIVLLGLPALKPAGEEIGMPGIGVAEVVEAILHVVQSATAIKTSRKTNGAGNPRGVCRAR